MESSKCSPILLVSAKDQPAASKIISDIIADETGDCKPNPNGSDCLWRITNKYYTADVCVRALLDGDKLETHLVDYVEAHVIYLTQDECNGEAVVETMQNRGQVCEGAHVRLVAADVELEPAALASACAHSRVELVALRERGDDDDGDGDDDQDARGARRLRAALHAHLWPGLKRHGHSDSQDPNSEALDSSSDEWSEWCSGPASDGAEARSEQVFLAGLASLPGAAAAARGGGGSREERLARAEHLVAAFCHALGTSLD